MSRSLVHFKAAKGGRGKSGTLFALENRQHLRDKAGRKPRPGYPIEDELAPQEAVDYLNSDPLICLLCGRKFQCLGRHLSMIHDITSREYCERFRIPWRWKGHTGLATNRLRKRMSDSAKSVPGMPERMRNLYKLSPKSEPGRKPTPQSKIWKVVKRETGPLRMKNCAFCGEPFRPVRAETRTCSKSCGNKLRWKGKKMPRRHCADCGEELPDGSQSNGVKRCFTCYHKSRRLTKEEKLERRRAYERRVYAEKREDPVWKEKERERNRERMRRKRQNDPR